MFLLDQVDDLLGRPAANSSSRLGSVARIVPLPGRARPRASHRQFMLLAVNMPEQEPQVGQAFCSMLGQFLFLNRQFFNNPLSRRFE